MSSSDGHGGARHSVLFAAAMAGWIAAAAAVASLFAGCGFHLRGDVTYAFTTLYINSPPNMPFAADMRRALSGGGTTVVETATAAQAILDLPSVVDDKQVLSLSGGGRAREYLLTKRVTFALHDANGRDWLPGGEIVIRRSYTFNESEVLAREIEETKLLREMQSDAVQQIMRRLQAAKQPA